MDIKIGAKVTPSRLTIDTVVLGTLRIQRIILESAEKKKAIPQKIPHNQQNARDAEESLRCSNSVFKETAALRMPAPPNKERIFKTLMDSFELHIDLLINNEKLIHPYYTPFFTKIQAFLAKIAFFVDYDGELC